MVRKGVVGDDPILRTSKLRCWTGRGAIRGTARPILGNAIADVVVNEIVRDRVRRSVCVDAVVVKTQVCRPSRACSKSPIMVDPVPIKQDPGATNPENPLKSIMMNPIPPNVGVVQIIILNPLVTIPYLKSLNRDPADLILITSGKLNKNPMTFRLVDEVNDRELARSVEELDGSRLSAGSSKSDDPFLIGPALDVGRIPCNHFRGCIGYGLPRLGAGARVAIVSSRGNIVRRRVGCDG